MEDIEYRVNLHKNLSQFSYIYNTLKEEEYNLVQKKKKKKNGESLWFLKSNL